MAFKIGMHGITGVTGVHGAVFGPQGRIVVGYRDSVCRGVVPDKCVQLSDLRPGVA